MLVDWSPIRGPLLTPEGVQALVKLAVLAGGALLALFIYGAP